MKHVEFPSLKIAFNIPENLAECTEKDFLTISYLVFQYLSGSIGFEEFRIHAITSLMNIRITERYQDDEEVMANIYLLSELMSGFFEDIEEKKQLKLDFIDVKVKSIKPIFRKYYGPEDMFSDIDYGEYCEAQRFFNSFHASGNVEFLYLLTAVLYRKKKCFSNKKELYNSKTLDKRVNYFKKYVSQSFIYATYLQFLAFQQYLPTAQLDWSGNVLDLSVLFEGEKSEDAIPGIGADSMVYTLAESGMLGNADAVRRTNFWEVMVLMYELRKRDIEREKEQNNAKNK